jgi:hypothetical protein
MQQGLFVTRQTADYVPAGHPHRQDQEMLSYTILTTGPEIMAEVHDRIPVIPQRIDAALCSEPVVPFVPFFLAKAVLREEFGKHPLRVFSAMQGYAKRCRYIFVYT